MRSRLRSRAAFRWAVAAAAGIAVLALARIGSELRFADRRVGVTVRADPAGGLAVLGVAAGSPAERGGLEAGDRLLALAGQPLAERRDFDRIAEGFERGQAVRLDAVRAGRPRQVELVPGMPPAVADLLLGLVLVVVYVALGLLATTRAEEDRRATLLAALSFAIACELALPEHPAPGGVGALGVALAFVLLTGLQFGLELHLAALIPSEPAWLARRPRLARVPYALGLGLGLTAAGAILADELGTAGAGRWRAAAESLLLDWMLPVWALAVAGLVGWRASHHPEPRGRHQAALVLLGLLPWVAIVGYETFVRLSGRGSPVPELVWSLALLVYPVAIFFAIFLYRLFDLELVVKRTAVYGTLTTLLVVVFWVLVGTAGPLFARRFEGPNAPIWVVSAATLAMGLLFSPLRDRLERWIDRKIFPERRALRSRLIELAAELPAQGKLPRMGEHLVRELGRIFTAEPVTLWIAAPPQGQLVELAAAGRTAADGEPSALIAADDPVLRRLARDGRPTPTEQLAQDSPALAERLAATGAELAVPLLAQERVIGLLLVGRRRERARFVAEEVELLALVARHIATVFENARLFDSATFEGLTGLYRREAILEILDREWSRSHRYQRPLAVVVADLDRFKAVNDRFGHLGGDVVLQRVAAELQALLRETDFIGRFGGEEFLIVLPETTLDGARRFAEKMRRRIEELEMRLDGGDCVRVTLSAGVASRDELRGDARLRGRALIAAADEALYAAKNAGRNRVEAVAAAR